MRKALIIGFVLAVAWGVFYNSPVEAQNGMKLEKVIYDAEDLCSGWRDTLRVRRFIAAQAHVDPEQIIQLLQAYPVGICESSK